MASYAQVLGLEAFNYRYDCLFTFDVIIKQYEIEQKNHITVHTIMFLQNRLKSLCAALARELIVSGLTELGIGTEIVADYVKRINQLSARLSR